MSERQGENELERKIIELREYCQAHQIPIFIAAWEPDNTQTGRKKGRDSYFYEYLSPESLHMDMKALTGEKNRFPEFLGAVLGFDRNLYKF